MTKLPKRVAWLNQVKLVVPQPLRQKLRKPVLKPQPLFVQQRVVNLTRRLKNAVVKGRKRQQKQVRQKLPLLPHRPPVQPVHQPFKARRVPKRKPPLHHKRQKHFKRPPRQIPLVMQKRPKHRAQPLPDDVVKVPKKHRQVQPTLWRKQRLPPPFRKP